ncbi:pyridoxine/pyridoxamine 5'-phosphate oxidase [Algimonas arctica]|uniref:Pyridoxine/pyridoxamine 5'-phosphate oxidase n=1 Tax=Algimonas arctica TaxID=1479486 RepID=A0A8J3CSN7_9PROT|nr:pyridoxamine 5'-phosphate oxidase [Algimonas arctica]GHA93372.1 pyridoxine/pyridoxamine 5'-phosphate oxidase [Algimonas arctica]
MTDSIPGSPTATDYLTDATERDLSWIEAADPMVLFDDWLAQAGQSEPNDPNAMSLATVDGAGQPDVRIVLLKGLSEAGFAFYTNSRSAKGKQLGDCPRAALCFHWKSQRRQVRVRGAVVEVGEAGSDAYFQNRARGSRLSAWASTQSAPATDRDELIASMTQTETRFDGKDVPRPPHWYGYRVVPDQIEFWQDGAFRLHDRILFTRTQSGWEKTRLYP